VLSRKKFVATQQGAEEHLNERHYVTVILRLLVNRNGHLERGDVVDAAGALHGRFASWPELITRLQGFLERDASRDA
jgi:hypothetical protein